MAKRSKLSPGELVVARAVWELGEGPVGAVHEEVCRRQAMDYAAVQTYLRRLEVKGVLAARRNGRTKIYRPKVAAARVVRDAVGDIVSRLFDGEILSMMNHLVRDHGIGTEEIAQLRRLLDEVEAERDEH
jgi:predicted transcriptional regulator